MSRRERVREGTRDEIKGLARRQMATSGTAALSLNGIARELGVVPSALYRYYPDRDALLTALVADAFAQLAAELLAADAGHARADHGARLLACGRTYRSWGLANRVDFQLLFTNPIPDYQPPEDVAWPGTERVFGVFLGILDEAERAGRLLTPEGYRPEILAPCPPDVAFASYSPLVMYAGMSGWARMHGLTTLEIYQQTDHTITDRASFFDGEMLAYLRALGISPG